MKLHIVSDVHLSRGPMNLPTTDADALIAAGDISRPQEAVAWLQALNKPVLYIAGNHEFYGGSIAGIRAELRRLCAGSNVHFLDNEEVVLDGVRFLGTTLWTDFMLCGEGEPRAEAMREAVRFMNDFRVIRYGFADQRVFMPTDAAELFAINAGWLEGKLAQPYTGRTVVITHHAPSPKSIHPRFANSLVNACFASDAERLVDARTSCLWVHGHMHDSFDYMLNGVRVVCNPRGYAVGDVNENARFDPSLVVEV
ncbi:MAG TPA: metallophosphoesterase family protein [Burkholderiaceae bacterium]|nr:metallophosphoesterase family protein [Burkholderiaceae bacterium]